MQNTITNIITACLLLVSTTGFSLSRHYCGEVLVEVAVNRQAETCCSDPDCCHTETEFYQLDEDFVGSILTFSKPEIPVLAEVIPSAYSFQLETTDAKISDAFSEGISPPVRHRFHLIFQVFLL